MKTFICCMLLVLIFPISLFGQAPTEGKNTFTIRDQRQDIFFYPVPEGTKSLNQKILFAPGDGGWRGLTIEIAQTVSSYGYDVFGIDTKRYLESFTGKTALKETDVMSDFLTIANWLSPKPNERVILFGWSEGAGLCLLASIPKENKSKFNGLVTMGLPDSAVLGWRWSDLTSYITKKDAKEPEFPTIGYMPKIAPLPFFMIQSTHDEYVTIDTANKLFLSAQQPKKLSLIEAQNHRFDGNKDEFYRKLREGLKWISETSSKKLR